MKKQITTTIITLLILLSTFGVVTAADNVQLQGMNPDQSIQNQGVMTLQNLTNNNQINGLCVDEGTYIFFGDIVPATDGTQGVYMADEVKDLIINNYRLDMSKEDGYNLQGAIWYFTDGRAPENQAQQDMINNAIANPTIYPDDYILILSEMTNLISVTSTTDIILLNTETTSNSVITQTGETITQNSVITQTGETITHDTITEYIESETQVTTEIKESIEKICTITTTTLTEFYKTITTTDTTQHFLNTTTTNTETGYLNITTTTTTNYYQKVITTTSTYQTVKEGLEFIFSSVQKADKQKLILFTANPHMDLQEFTEVGVEVSYFDEKSEQITKQPFTVYDQQVTFNEFNESFRTVTENPYNITTVTVDKSCKDKPKNEPAVPESIPMQKTGAGGLVGLIGVLLVCAGFGFRRKW